MFSLYKHKQIQVRIVYTVRLCGRPYFWAIWFTYNQLTPPHTTHLHVDFCMPLCLIGIFLSPTSSMIAMPQLGPIDDFA